MSIFVTKPADVESHPPMKSHRLLGTVLAASVIVSAGLFFGTTSAIADDASSGMNSQNSTILSSNDAPTPDPVASPNPSTSPDLAPASDSAAPADPSAMTMSSKHKMHTKKSHGTKKHGTKSGGAKTHVKKTHSSKSSNANTNPLI